MPNPRRSRVTEQERLQALRSYRVLDSVAESTFDSITDMAAKVCGTPMAILTFLDERRQWFKSRVGVSLSETPREIAFCNRTIANGEFTEVPDAKLNPEFRDNPLVVKPPNIRSYAGAPLLTPDNCAIGTLAVLDTSPRNLTPLQREVLEQLARHAMLLLELRRSSWDSSERYRVITEASPLPIVMLDRELRVVLWNSAAERLFQWRSDEVIGQTYPLVPAHEWQSYRNVLDEVFSGKTARLRECTRIKRDGTGVRADAFWAPVRTEKGEVIGGMVILQDITAQLETEERLQQSLSILTATLDSTADGMLVVDRNGKVVAQNRRFVEIWRLPEEVLNSGNDAAAIEAVLNQLNEPQRFIDRVNQLYANPEEDSFDILELVDGRIIERYSQPQRIGNQIVGRVWSFRDVTERVTLENHLRQSQKMEAVGALAGGIAHDFNNLLNIIIGYNSLVRAELSPGSQLADYTETLNYAAERAAGLTKQLLAFSRRQVLRPVVLELNELTNNLCQMLPRVLPENIDVHVELGSKPIYVYADPGQLEQVLMNLAVNARDAMPKGGELRISTTTTQEDGIEFAQVAVHDSGEGIAPDVLPRIFEPFFTTKAIGHGTGLGLSTAYGIVRQSNGTIHVQSEVGQGTSFEIRLPVAAEPAQSATAARLSESLSNQHDSGHILLVEDDDGLRQLLAQILRNAGYNVLELSSPEDALRAISQNTNTFDLLLTDLIMPQMTGAELAEKALHFHPDLKVTIMSGYLADDVTRRELAATLLEKPFSPETLLAHVRSVLTREETKRKDDAA